MPRTCPGSMAARSRRTRSPSPPAATRPSSSRSWRSPRPATRCMLPTPWYFNHKMTLDMLGIEAVRAALPRRGRLRARRRRTPSALIDRARARHRAGHAQQSDRRRLSARDHPTRSRSFAPSTASRSSSTRPIAISSTPKPRHRTTASPTPDWPDTLIQLYSFSKSYCIPGHRVGAMVAGAGLLDEIAKILDTLQICAPRAPQLALPWAIPALADWRDGNRAEIARARRGLQRAPSRRLDGWSIGSIGAYFAYVRHPYRRPPRRRCLRLARGRARRALPARLLFRRRPGGISARRFANVDAAAIAENHCRPRSHGCDYARAPRLRHGRLGRIGRRMEDCNGMDLRREPEAARGPNTARRAAAPSATRSSSKVADTHLRRARHARRALCRHSDLPRRAAPRRSTGSAPDFGDLQVAIDRRPDGSRRHQPQRRPLRPARACAPSSASAPTTTCSKLRADRSTCSVADIGDVPFRSRFSLELSHEDIERAISASSSTPASRRSRSAATIR